MSTWFTNTRITRGTRIGGGAVGGASPTPPLLPPEPPEPEARLEKVSISNLSSARVLPGAATTGNYALFGGGLSSSANVGTDTVDTYDLSLTWSLADPLSIEMKGLVGLSVVDFALFVGSTSSYSTREADVYDDALTHSLGNLLPYNVGNAPLSVTLGDHALFGGHRDTANTVDTMFVCDSTLTFSSISSLRGNLVDCAAVVGNYGLFCTAYDDHSNGPTPSRMMDVYSETLTKTTASSPASGKIVGGAASTGKHALFGGGYYWGGSQSGVHEWFDTVDAYDETLTRSVISPLGHKRTYIGGGSLDGFALLAGGYAEIDSLGYVYGYVDVYDLALTRFGEVDHYLDVGRDRLASVTIVDTVIFAAGNTSYYGTGAVSMTDAYKVVYDE